MKKFMLVLLMVSFCLSMTGCAAESRVSDETMSTLRADYPYNDYTSSIASSVPAEDVYRTFEDFVPKNRYYFSGYYGVAVIRITSQWRSFHTEVLPYNDDALNATLPAAESNINWPVFDAVIEKVIWGGSDWKKGTTITVGFGSDQFVHSMHLEETYQDGGRFVCFLSASPAEFGKSLFMTTQQHSFYVTEEDVILSVSSVPGAEECSGLKLKAFCEKIDELLANETQQQNQ